MLGAGWQAVEVSYRAGDYIAVVGSGHAQAALGPLGDWAEEVGRLLGEAKVTLLCGGLGGVMESACRGALSAGGTTVGILPGDDRRAANPAVQIAVATGMGEMRNALLVRSSDALIALGGEFGTLSEVGFALKIGRPVVGLSTWSLYRPDGSPEPSISIASSPSEAVSMALEAVDHQR